jgi:isocitrate dehydrogenase
VAQVTPSRWMRRISRRNDDLVAEIVSAMATEEQYALLKRYLGARHAGGGMADMDAFEYAVKNNRKKVTCMSKDNIMKVGDGMFHRIFNEIAVEYPQIETEHYIIDIGAARLAAKPQIFDVIVTLNLYGDIISDIVAEVSGSVGLAGSGNIGSRYSMF